MIVEHFKNGVLCRSTAGFANKAAWHPKVWRNVSSWVREKLERCYQIMETDHRALLDQWVSNWSDLIDFEIYTVIPSKEAAGRIRPRL